MLQSLKTYCLTCSMPLFFSGPPSPCPCSTETLAHAPALCPHISCPSPPHLGQSSRANDMDRCKTAVKHTGLIQWDLTTRSPFSGPVEPPQSSGMHSLNHWRACQTQPLLQHNIPLPKGNHFPYSYSLIYSWLDTTPTSLVNATYTGTWSAAAETNPRGGRVIDVPYTACHQLRKFPSERINCLSSASQVPHTVLDEGCLSQTPPYR